MKMKYLKIAALVVAVILIAGLAWFANAFLGNPVSKLIAKHAAEKYMETTYGETDFYIERMGYSFKMGNYYAFVKSPTSMDTDFSFYISMTGEIYNDTYDSVTEGFVTARRLEDEYRTLAKTVLEASDYPYNKHDSFGYGTLEIYPPEALNDPLATDVPDYAMDQSKLIVDRVYDIRELGGRAGHLVIYVDSDLVTMEHAAEIMLDIKARFDAAGIPFVAMDLVLQYPRPEEGRRPDGEVRVEQFLYDDIYEEGLSERVAEADAERKAYYAALDAKYK